MRVRIILKIYFSAFYIPMAVLYFTLAEAREKKRIMNFRPCTCVDCADAFARAFVEDNKEILEKFD